MLYTASFYHRENWRGKAYRISLGYPRGIKKAWEDLPFLYPTRDIVADYRSGRIGSAEYEARYKALLEERAEEVNRWLKALSPEEEDITLLCFEPEGDFCHRRVVASLVSKARPDIKVTIR